MDQRIFKLNHYINDAALAAELVEAGLDTPRKIKATKRADLVKKVGRAKADKVRKKIK